MHYIEYQNISAILRSDYLAIAKAANETGDEKPITREIQLLR